MNPPNGSDCARVSKSLQDVRPSFTVLSPALQSYGDGAIFCRPSAARGSYPFEVHSTSPRLGGIAQECSTFCPAGGLSGGVPKSGKLNLVTNKKNNKSLFSFPPLKVKQKGKNMRKGGVFRVTHISEGVINTQPAQVHTNAKMGLHNGIFCQRV